MSAKKAYTKRTDALTGSNEKIEFHSLVHHTQGVIRRGYYLTADLYHLFRQIIRNGDEEALKKAIWQDSPMFDFWDIYESVSLAIKMENFTPNPNYGNNAEAESSRKWKTPSPPKPPSPTSSVVKEVSLGKCGEPSLEDADLLINLKSPKKAKFTFQFNDFEEWLNAL